MKKKYTTPYACSVECNSIDVLASSGRYGNELVGEDPFEGGTER